MARLLVADLGTCPYDETLEVQRAVARARIGGDLDDDVLLLVEHPPVVTLGRRSSAGNLLASPAVLRSRGVELFEVDRGGDVTFHGPGQLVGYPILDLKRHRRDLHWYLRQIEAVLIEAIEPFALAGERSPGQTGVWLGGGRRKVASIGVHARDWVTWHGFALNVSTDLAYFDLMVPCGIAGVTMTSIAHELGIPAEGSFELGRRARVQVTAAFADVFGLQTTAIDHAALARLTPGEGSPG